MSTKAIRKFLHTYGRNAPLDGERHRLAQEAREEVEAIEKAAKALDERLPGRFSPENPPEVIGALNLMQSIARDAP